MIPFSGLIQAVDGAAFPPGANRTGMGAGKANRIHGQQEPHPAKDATLFLDDADGSFVEWVKKLMDTEARVAADGEPVPGFPDSGHDSASVVPFPVEQKKLRTPPEEGGDHEQSAVPTDELTALIAQAGDGQLRVPKGELTNFIALAGDGQSAAPKGELRATIAQNGDGQAADSPVRSALSAFQSTVASEKYSPVAGLTQSPAEGQDRQTHAIGIPTSIGQDGDSKGDASAFSMEVKAADPALSKPVIASGDEGASTSSPVADSRLPSGLAPDGKGLDPASVPLPSIDARKKEQEAVNTQSVVPADVNKKALPTGQLPESVKTADPEPARSPAVFKNPGTAVESKTPADMASPENDSADSRENARHSRSQRIAMAEIKDTESPKDQPLDSTKSTPVESIKSQTGFQETAKAMAVEPSTTAAERTAAGQSAALTRTDPSAVKTFQSTVMDQIVDQASLRSIGGRSEVQIRLKPDFLGHVQMNIATDKELVVVRIITDQPVVKDIIETHLHHLKAELQHQGLTIDKFDVMVSPDADQQHSREQFSQMFKNNSSNHGRRQAPEHEPDSGNPQGDHAGTDDERSRDGVNYFA